MQKARQEYMERQQRWKKERLRKMSTPGHRWIISQDEPRRRDFGSTRTRNKTSNEDKKEENTDMENKQDHLQGLSWPVSSNGEGLLISVKPLHTYAEPEEETRALTPSTADHNTDHTMEDSVREQEITAEEPGQQPQAFSEPQKDTQIFTDGSKLATEDKHEAEEATSSQLDNLKQSVLKAISKGTMVQCCVQRDRTDKSGPTYRMFREIEGGKKQLLLVARRMKKSKASSFVISVDESNKADSVVGALRSNKKRTEFILYDKVREPGEIDEALLAEACMKELAAISYEKVLGLRKLQQMSVVIPGKDKIRERRPVYVFTAQESTLKKLLKNKKSKLITLEVKKPVWNAEMKACALDFNGRVKKTSAKNFQLICPKNPEKLVMQFGRVDEEHFALDYSAPLCALQAFAIALSWFEE
ncbi:hypothetical protein MHYP_G00274300 [Metynnis hypsauchen]